MSTHVGDLGGFKAYFDKKYIHIYVFMYVFIYFFIYLLIFCLDFCNFLDYNILCK